MERFVRLVAVLALVVTIGVAVAGAAAPSFRAPIRLGFAGGDDWEPAIAADRYGHVYVLWTHYGADPACPGCSSPHSELQVSSDHGLTWSAPRPLTPSPGGRQDDPQIAVDPVDGRTVYAASMEGKGDKSSQFVSRSDDFGQTWHRMLVEPLERGTDKDILAVRGQDVYLVYNAVQKTYASVSQDGGQTWSLHHVIPNTNSKLGWSLPGGGAIDSKGNAYFGWAGYTQNGKPSGDVNLYVTKSSDGGNTWTVSHVDTSGAPPPCGCAGWAYWGSQLTLAVDGNDRVYVLYNASGSKNAVNRMLLARSDDGGATWVARQDVSLAPTGTNNLFPAIVARGSGDVRIAWMDDRQGLDPGADDPSARWNTYYRTSANAGVSWSAETVLSGYTPGYTYLFPDGFLEPYGDYMELDVDGDGKTHAVWGEGPSYDGPGNVWYAGQ
jgi:hypothetical protein